MSPTPRRRARRPESPRPARRPHRVDVLLGRLTGQLFDLLGDLASGSSRRPGGDFVDLVRVVTRVLERLLGRVDGAIDQILRQRLELGSSHGLLEVDRAVVGRCNEGQVDLGLLPTTEFDLGLLGGVLEPLEGLSVVVAEVDTVFVLELVGEPVDDGLVPVVPTEVVVTVGRDDLVDAAAEIENRDVEGTATEVVDENGLVRSRRRGRRPSTRPSAR